MGDLVVTDQSEQHRTYAWWASEMASAIADLLRDPRNDLIRMRARKLVDDFDDTCREFERRIHGGPLIAPESIRAELYDIARRPERFFGAAITELPEDGCA